MGVSFSHVSHAVTYLPKLTVCQSLRFFLFPFKRPLSRVVLYCTWSPLFTLLAFALERISLCT